MSRTLRRLIVEMIARENLSASQVLRKMGLNVSVPTVQRLLQESENVEYRDLGPRPHLTLRSRSSLLK